jgi:hypothetical protein
MEKHLSHQLDVEGLNTAAAAGTGQEHNEKKEKSLYVS